MRQKHRKVVVRLGRPVSLKDRLERRDGTKCTTPFCGRPSMAAAGIGLAQFLCKRCVARKARHGSAWCPSFLASDLRPYLAVAREWIASNRERPSVAFALIGLRFHLEGSGRVQPAMSIKRLPAATRARIAFGRLREADIKPERLLAIHTACSALLEDDAGAHRMEEFLIVQVAKAAHRLASGTHRHWGFPKPDGTTVWLALHDYPKSSGQILRIMGQQLHDLCAEASDEALGAVREAKAERHGLHPSHPSRVAETGWRPRWQLWRDAAATQSSNASEAKRRSNLASGGRS